MIIVTTKKNFTALLTMAFIGMVLVSAVRGLAKLISYLF